MSKKHRDMQQEFLTLSPAQRVDIMDRLFLEGLELFAYQKGISIDEAYKEISKKRFKEILQRYKSASG